MEEYKNYKIEMTEREFELLQKITAYAIKQKEIYLNRLLKSEYGRDEREIHKTAAELVSFKVFKDSIESPF